MVHASERYIDPALPGYLRQSCCVNSKTSTEPTRAELRDKVHNIYWGACSAMDTLHNSVMTRLQHRIGCLRCVLFLLNVPSTEADGDISCYRNDHGSQKQHDLHYSLGVISSSPWQRDQIENFNTTIPKHEFVFVYRSRLVNFDWPKILHI